MYRLTAAHKSLPFGSLVRVERLDSQRTVVVRINDRGPFVSGRIIDLSYQAAKDLGIIASGTAPVRITLEHRTGSSTHGIFWVQVGSLANLDKARMLARRLAVRFPTVRIVSVSVKTTTRHRVQVGTFSSESKAWSVAKQLQGEFDTAPFVMQGDTTPN